MQSTHKLFALAMAFAIPVGLVAQTASIERALDRAVQVRAGNIQPPGSWTTGVMLPREAGMMNYDSNAAVPNQGPRMLWIGGNGG
jgi:hypothetical protein